MHLKLLKIKYICCLFGILLDVYAVVHQNILEADNLESGQSVQMQRKIPLILFMN